MYPTTRDLTRRWYGQIGKPLERNYKGELAFSPLANNASYSAHTIIPSVNRFNFGHARFAPLSDCLDVVLSTVSNTIDEPVALILKAYRSGYDVDTNMLCIGGYHNLLFVKDLCQRPVKETDAPTIIQPVTQPALLLAYLEMDSEREAVTRCERLARMPNICGAVLSFDPKVAPEFTVTRGLLIKAISSLYSDSPPLKALCTPPGFDGSVYRVLRSRGVTAIAIIPANPMLDEQGRPTGDDAIVYEVPEWADVSVRQGSIVRGNRQLAKLSLTPSLLGLLQRSNHTPETMWDGIVDNIGEQDAKQLLRMVWESCQTKWAGMVMIQHDILLPEHAKKASGVWRDIGSGLGRVCHHYLSPNRIIRFNAQEGALSVWKGSPDELRWEDHGVSVDLAA